MAMRKDGEIKIFLCSSSMLALACAVYLIPTLQTKQRGKMGNEGRIQQPGLAGGHSSTHSILFSNRE